MKYLLALLMACSVFAADRLPFGPELNSELNSRTKKTLTVEWDATKGDLGDSTVSSGSHALGAKLPPNSVVTRSWVWVETALTSTVTDFGANDNLAFECEDSENLFAAADLTVYPGTNAVDGVATGASTVFGIIDAECDVTAVLGGSSFSAGKVYLFVDYVVAE